MILEKIGALTSNIANGMFGKTPEKRDLYGVGNSFINKVTNKRLVVTGRFNGVVEFVESELKDGFKFDSINFVNIEKSKTPMENFEKTLLDLGYQL